jgi:hypothetical protein
MEKFIYAVAMARQWTATSENLPLWLRSAGKIGRPCAVAASLYVTEM